MKQSTTTNLLASAIEDELFGNWSKKQFIDGIEELTHSRDVLRREIEDVRKYYNKLKDLNSKLKEMKEKEQTQKEIYQSGMNLGMQSTQQARQITMVSHQHSSSPIAAQIHTLNNGLGWVNRVGPVELPYLNVSLEEAVVVSPSQPLGVERDRQARFAEARRFRRMRRGITNNYLTNSS